MTLHPIVTSLIDEIVGARLILNAGSLSNLAKCPASILQILGAEKALFRALKTRGNTPKHDLIFHSSFIGRASTCNKGRLARYLANKCSIASRIDCFSVMNTTAFGEKLREQVEERQDFYDEEVDIEKEAADVSVKKNKKKSKGVTDTETMAVGKSTDVDGDASAKLATEKKKKKKKHESDQEQEAVTETSK